jgi:hypothetical protein
MQHAPALRRVGSTAGSTLLTLFSLSDKFRQPPVFGPAKAGDASTALRLSKLRG